GVCRPAGPPAAARGAGAVVGLLVPLWFGIAALSTAISNAGALALSRHGDRAGTAAAVIGSVQGGLGGAVAPLVGVVGGTGVAMAGVMLTTAVLAVVVLAVGTPAYRRGGAAELDETAGAAPAPAA